MIEATAQRRNFVFILVTGIMLGGLAPAAALAQATRPGPVSVSASRTPPTVLTVYLSQSKVVDAPWPVKRVAVTDPAIADVQVLTPRTVLVQGKKAGSTDLLLFSESEHVWHARVDVEVDLDRLGQELKKLFPDAELHLDQNQDVVAISGSFRRAEQIDQMHKYLAALGVKYVDMSYLAGVQQVLLQVRVAEVSRQAMRALGINGFYSGSQGFGGSQIGSSGGPLNPISIGVPEGSIATSRMPFTFTSDAAVTPSVTIFGGSQRWGFEFFVQALAENQYLRILAEPNLVALSGQEADFLAGGQYPIPVVQGTGLSQSVTIQYKEYGVRLRFRPEVAGDNGIRLFVAPEVSELSDTGAVEIQGFRVPALITRRAATTLELKSGQTFAMAGLIQRSNTAHSSRVPGLGDIPVLGALFRSVRYTEGETELVVLVTASLVEPLSTAGEPAAPGAAHAVPNDWELYALGKIEGEAPAKIAPSQAQWLKQMGLDRLRGPGAWADYDQPAPYSQASAQPPPKPAPQPIRTIDHGE